LILELFNLLNEYFTSKHSVFLANVDLIFGNNKRLGK